MSEVFESEETLMTGDEFKDVLHSQNVSPLAFAHILSLNPRTVQRWGVTGPSPVAVFLLDLILASGMTIEEAEKSVNEFRADLLVGLQDEP